jgi:hypothetical protein
LPSGRRASSLALLWMYLRAPLYLESPAASGMGTATGQRSTCQDHQDTRGTHRRSSCSLVVGRVYAPSPSPSHPYPSGEPNVGREGCHVRDFPASRGDPGLSRFLPSLAAAIRCAISGLVWCRWQQWQQCGSSSSDKRRYSTILDKRSEAWKPRRYRQNTDIYGVY